MLDPKDNTDAVNEILYSRIISDAKTFQVEKPVVAAGCGGGHTPKTTLWSPDWSMRGSPQKKKSIHEENLSKAVFKSEMDKFYTRGHVVEMCINCLKLSVPISRDDVIIEPSAGAGAFIPSLRAMTDHLLCYDTHPEHPDVEAMDFLTYTPGQGRIHVVGNPPFGRQSAMAVRFIRHAAGFAATIAFILPRSFRKPSMHARIPNTFHLINEIMLPQDSFMIDGDKPHHVPCVFQVWVHTDGPRREVHRGEEPRGFRFVRRTDNPDIAIRRVGFHAGRISTEAHDKSEQSHYFVRFDLGYPIIDKIKCPQGRDDTVGPRSLSKAEVIAAINEAINQM